MSKKVSSERSIWHHLQIAPGLIFWNICNDIHKFFDLSVHTLFGATIYLAVLKKKKLKEQNVPLGFAGSKSNS